MRILSISTALIVLIIIPLSSYSQFTQQQKTLDGNNISAFIINTGILDQDISQQNHPGFEWPKGSGKFAIFTGGLTIAAKVNGQIRMAAASYNGEYRPGYINNGAPFTDSRFHIFKIKRGDTTFTNPDYAEWGNMVPYGAPYIDVNNNGLFELGIDRPGIKDASQTVFICLTDGFTESHMSKEGLGGGTEPLLAEVHFTAWCYDNSGLEDVQFLKWEVINKSTSLWEGSMFTLFYDTDLGDANDDFIGCDTLLDLAFTYNSDNFDSGYYGGYGANPPAVGFGILSSPLNLSTNSDYGLVTSTTFTIFGNSPVCQFPPSNPQGAYNIMKGIKVDGSPWKNPLNYAKTVYLYSGDPETGAGWNEDDGSLVNCGGDSGYTIPRAPGDRKMVLSTSDSLFNLPSGQSVTIVASQQIARGNNNLNSVSKLKQLTNTVRNFWQTIGITPISSEVPETFRLHQNYPNPFNPSTKIRFDVPGNKEFVKLIIYDISGREVAKLVNQELAPGVYEYEFNGEGLSSGIYFYTLNAGEFAETKKMVLVK